VTGTPAASTDFAAEVVARYPPRAAPRPRRCTSPMPDRDDRRAPTAAGPTHHDGACHDRHDTSTPPREARATDSDGADFSETFLSQATLREPAAPDPDLSPECRKAISDLLIARALEEERMGLPPPEAEPDLDDEDWGEERHPLHTR
jgi:hypothetical protein